MDGPMMNGMATEADRLEGLADQAADAIPDQNTARQTSQQLADAADALRNGDTPRAHDLLTAAHTTVQAQAQTATGQTRAALDALLAEMSQCLQAVAGLVFAGHLNDRGY